MNESHSHTAQLVVQTEDGEKEIPISNVNIFRTGEESGFQEWRLTGEIGWEDVPDE